MSLANTSGIFVTGTDTGVGKTVVAGGIGACLRQLGRRVGVFKPVATGCRRRRGRLESADAAFLAHCTDTAQSLEQITPIAFTEPLQPTVAAERAGTPIDLAKIRSAYRRVCQAHDCVVVEGIGGLAVPIARRYTVADFAAECGLPLVIVARAGLGTINHTYLSCRFAQQHNIHVAGVIINQYDVQRIGIAEEANPAQISRLTGLPVLAIVPQDSQTDVAAGRLGPDVLYPLAQVDWLKLSQPKTRSQRA